MSAMVPMITAVMPTPAPVLMAASVPRVVSAEVQITSTSIGGQELADCMTEGNKRHNGQ